MKWNGIREILEAGIGFFSFVKSLNLEIFVKTMLFVKRRNIEEISFSNS